MLSKSSYLSVCVWSHKEYKGKFKRSQASNVASEGLSTHWCDGSTVVQSTRNSGLTANLYHNSSRTESSPSQALHVAVLCDAVNTQLWTYS